MRKLAPILLVSVLAPFGCKTLRPALAELSFLPINCQEPVALQSYLKGQISCTADGFYTSTAEARKRDLSAWIPCNDVEWIDDTTDLFGSGGTNTPETLDQSTYARIFRDWLGAADRFTPEMASKVFQNLDQPLAFNAGNPILESAMGRSIKELIGGAQSSIVMDIFLLGGSWGADILHDLGAAADRGVDVILLHDNAAKTPLANEMEPLWAAAQQFSLRHPKFVALDAHIHPPQRVSSLPFGFEKLGGILAGQMDLSGPGEGRADHSKILIIDALYHKSPDEYLQMKPRVLIGSRDLVDSAASFYHDEAVVVRGPAAVVALLDYESDVKWAWEQAKKTKKLNAADEVQLQGFLDRLSRLRSTPTLVQGQGWVNVQPLQISANDEVRNLDSGIIPRIMAAERSIDLYDRVAYNWPLAMALKEAMARGVKVRIILDQQTSSSALANAVFPYMIAEAPRRFPDGRETKQLIDESGKVIREPDLPVKWFVPFRPGQNFASKDRTDLLQEMHAKTIIIDGRLALFGSANLDSLSWAGGFREYSVWVDDSALASESARQFDRLWNHPLLTVSHKVWMGDEAPPQILVDYLSSRQKASGCEPQAELCKLDPVLQGGMAFPEKGPKRELIKSLLSADADRIRLLIPAKVIQDDQGRPQCRTL